MEFQKMIHCSLGHLQSMQFQQKSIDHPKIVSLANSPAKSTPRLEKQKWNKRLDIEIARAKGAHEKNKKTTKEETLIASRSWTKKPHGNIMQQLLKLKNEKLKEKLAIAKDLSLEKSGKELEESQVGRDQQKRKKSESKFLNCLIRRTHLNASDRFKIMISREGAEITNKSIRSSIRQLLRGQNANRKHKASGPKLIHQPTTSLDDLRARRVSNLFDVTEQQYQESLLAKRRLQQQSRAHQHWMYNSAVNTICAEIKQQKYLMISRVMKERIPTGLSIHRVEQKEKGNEEGKNRQQRSSFGRLRRYSRNEAGYSQMAANSQNTLESTIICSIKSLRPATMEVRKMKKQKPIFNTAVIEMLGKRRTWRKTRIQEEEGLAPWVSPENEHECKLAD